jgi:hypothetical protein
MASIFYWQGSISLEERITWHLLGAHLETCLKREKASFTLASSDSVLFRVNLFRFVSDWNVLTPFDRGELRIDRKRRLLIYSLSLKRSILSVLAGLAFLVPLLLTASPDEERFLWIVLPLAWIATFFQVWLGVHRFRRFLIRAVDGAPAAPKGMPPGGYRHVGKGGVAAG